MNILIKLALLSIVLLSGCTTVTVRMNVDESLASQAVVYNLKHPNSLSDKISGNRLNVSFGPYQVTEADLSWTRTSSEAEDPDPFFIFKETNKVGTSRGNVTTTTTTTTSVGIGPTSILGFSRTPAEGEPTIDKSYRTVKYRFSAGQEHRWNALCVHRGEKRVVETQINRAVETLSSNFICQYKQDTKSEDHEIWVLSVDLGGVITMTQKGKANRLTAHTNDGVFVKPDGQVTSTSTRNAGYTWRQRVNGRDKNIAAISVKEETPRVWLHKENSDDLNRILAMANTALLIHHWEIHH